MPRPSFLSRIFRNLLNRISQRSVETNANQDSKDVIRISRISEEGLGSETTDPKTSSVSPALPENTARNTDKARSFNPYANDSNRDRQRPVVISPFYKTGKSEVEEFDPQDSFRLNSNATIKQSTTGNAERTLTPDPITSDDDSKDFTNTDSLSSAATQQSYKFGESKVEEFDPQDSSRLPKNPIANKTTYAASMPIISDEDDKGFFSSDDSATESSTATFTRNVTITKSTTGKTEYALTLDPIIDPINSDETDTDSPSIAEEDQPKTQALDSNSGLRSGDNRYTAASFDFPDSDYDIFDILDKERREAENKKKMMKEWSDKILQDAPDVATAIDSLEKIPDSGVVEYLEEKNRGWTASYKAPEFKVPNITRENLFYGNQADLDKSSSYNRESTASFDLSDYSDSKTNVVSSASTATISRPQALRNTTTIAEIRRRLRGRADGGVNELPLTTQNSVESSTGSVTSSSSDLHTVFTATESSNDAGRHQDFGIRYAMDKGAVKHAIKRLSAASANSGSNRSSVLEGGQNQDPKSNPFDRGDSARGSAHSALVDAGNAKKPSPTAQSPKAEAAKQREVKQSWV